MVRFPVAKVVKDMETEIVADFLVKKIFIYYGPNKELLLDNGTNLLVNIMEHYLLKFYFYHKYITIYYLQTNGKFENLNSTLGDKLTKYLADKATKLWDKYLLQALFAIKI